MTLILAKERQEKLVETAKQLVNAGGILAADDLPGKLNLITI